MHADAHLKNYSLLLAGPNCVLAPLYDATSWLPYRRGPQGSIRLVLGIGDADTLDGTDRPEAILRAADHFKMPALDVADDSRISPRRCQEPSKTPQRPFRRRLGISRLSSSTSPSSTSPSSTNGHGAATRLPPKP